MAAISAYLLQLEQTSGGHMPSDQLFSTIIPTLACLTPFVILFIIFIYFIFRPKARRRRKLHAWAEQEYRNSRGTSHLGMLRNSHKVLTEKRNKYQLESSNLNLELIDNNKTEQIECENAIVHDLVMHHLNIPGIGPSLAQQIQRSVFRGKLEDLRIHKLLMELGQNRQKAITSWVNLQSTRIPELQDSGFPGKLEIQEKYRRKNQLLKDNISSIESEIVRLNILIDIIEKEIKRLDRISIHDFRDAIIDKSIDQSALEHYVTGVFAEWEPMPDWFRDALRESAE
jgi:hypothetical protein